MFSDTEASNIEDSIVVVNVSEDKTKSIEIVTLGDSISSDSETESPKPKKIDENKAVEKNIMTKVEPQDDETNTGEDNSSIKESSNNDDNPEPANEEVDLANAAQTSTPDQGRLRPNSQANTSLEDSQALSSENLERKILEAIGNYFFNIAVTYNNKPERVFGHQVRCRELDIFKIFFEIVWIFLGFFGWNFSGGFFGRNFLGGIVWELFEY